MYVLLCVLQYKHHYFKMLNLQRLKNNTFFHIKNFVKSFIEDNSHFYFLVQDLRRNQKRIAELNATIRKLEDRNTLLGDERNELVSSKQLFYKFYYFLGILLQQYVHVHSLSRVQLFVTPQPIAHQAPLSMGFSRQAY